MTLVIYLYDISPMTPMTSANVPGKFHDFTFPEPKSEKKQHKRNKQQASNSRSIQSKQTKDLHCRAGLLCPIVNNNVGSHRSHCATNSSQTKEHQINNRHLMHPLHCMQLRLGRGLQRRSRFLGCRFHKVEQISIRRGRSNTSSV